MKITFQGDNGTSRLIIQPDTQRDKMYLDLCREAGKHVKLEATKDPEAVVIVFTREE